MDLKRKIKIYNYLIAMLGVGCVIGAVRRCKFQNVGLCNLLNEMVFPCAETHHILREILKAKNPTKGYMYDGFGNIVEIDIPKNKNLFYATGYYLWPPNSVFQRIKFLRELKKTNEKHLNELILN